MPSPFLLALDLSWVSNKGPGLQLSQHHLKVNSTEGRIESSRCMIEIKLSGVIPVSTAALLAAMSHAFADPQ